MDTRVYAPVHRRVIFQRVHSMSKSLDILNKNWLFRKKRNLRLFMRKT